jgi:type II secretory pathway predicted ATPase ExeA
MERSVVTPAVESERTVSDRITLREYFDQKINAREKYVDAVFTFQKTAVEAALAAADRATTKSEISIDSRLLSMNEFRKALDDAQRLTMPRSEADLRFTTLEASVRGLQQNMLSGAAQSHGESRVWSLVLGLGGLVAGVIAGYLSGGHLH